MNRILPDGLARPSGCENICRLHRQVGESDLLVNTYFAGMIADDIADDGGGIESDLLKRLE